MKKTPEMCSRRKFYINRACVLFFPILQTNDRSIAMLILDQHYYDDAETPPTGISDTP